MRSGGLVRRTSKKRATSSSEKRQSFRQSQVFSTDSNPDRSPVKCTEDNFRKRVISADISDERKWPVVRVVISACLLLLGLVFVWPTEFKPQPFRYGEAPLFEGPLEPNNLLSNSEKIYENQLTGPEAIVVHNEHIYTGTSDGKVLDLHSGEIRLVVDLAKNCGNSSDSCGRPLGMRITPAGLLLIVDAYLGLFTVDPQSGGTTYLLSGETLVHANKLQFLNDVVMTSEGVIYFSQTSLRWTVKDFMWTGLENADDGRVLRYDPLTKIAWAVCHGAYHPNGLELSLDESYLLIVDTVRVLINKCYLQGEREGEVEVFTDNMPGYPDNIRLGSRDTYWVAMTATRNRSVVKYWEVLGPYPLLKLICYKVIQIRQHPLVIAILKKVGVQPGPPKRKRYGLVLELSQSGEIVSSLHDPTGHIVGISHVQEYKGSLYMGSAKNNYIAKLTLN